MVAFAEQLGRVVGTVQARTEGWLDPKALQSQMASIRDGAADVLEHLAEQAKMAMSSARRGADAARANATPRGRSGGAVDAPGKRHRQPNPSNPGTKHSDTRIAKMKVANESRRYSRG